MWTRGDRCHHTALTIASLFLFLLSHRWAGADDQRVEGNSTVCPTDFLLIATCCNNVNRIMFLSSRCRLTPSPPCFCCPVSFSACSSIPSRTASNRPPSKPIHGYRLYRVALFSTVRILPALTTNRACTFNSPPMFESPFNATVHVLFCINPLRFLTC